MHDDLTSQDSRIEREREFHNREFSVNSREKINSVYLVTRSSSRYYLDQLFSQAEGRRILEYGCGPNSYAFMLAERGAQVVGIDISDQAIELMRNRASEKPFPERVSFQRMNAESLEFESGSFDIICGRAILHHLDLKASFRELARTLKPTGQALFVEPMGHNPLINYYRNRTPDLRTPDEHPLLMSDFDLARQYFGRVDVKFFHLSGLAATPFAGRPGFDTILNLLDGADQAMFTVLPFLKKHAWAAVITLSEPRQ